MAEKKKGLAGYMLSFVPVKDMTVGELFGLKPVAATQLMAKLWVLIKVKNLKVK